MAQRLPTGHVSDRTVAFPCGYVFDPADPRSPSVAQWKAMTKKERARVVDMLPASPKVEGAFGDAFRRAEAEAEARHLAEERAASLEKELKQVREELARLKSGRGKGSR